MPQFPLSQTANTSTEYASRATHELLSEPKALKTCRDGNLLAALRLQGGPHPHALPYALCLACK